MKPTPTRPLFRTCSQGYYREDVDVFVRALADERTQLEERVADLEAVLDATVQGLQARLTPQQHELLRLTGENRGRARSSTMLALRETPRVPTRIAAERFVGVTSIAMNARPPVTPSHRLAFVLVALLAAAVTVPVMLYLRMPASIVAAPASPAIAHGSVSGDARPDLRPGAPTAARPGAAVPAQPPTDGLTILVTASDLCWIGATLDGQNKLERLMHLGETAILHARDDVVLRAGDAGALSLTINGIAAAPLGRPGEPVTTHITLANYKRLARQSEL